MQTRTRSVFLVAGLVLALPAAQGAELYAEVYGGVAETSERILSIEEIATGGRVAFSPDYDSSFSGGIRFGLWPVSVPWLGFAQDFSYFSADGNGASFDVYSVSPMLMLRVPLAKSRAFPHGRVYPYAGIGPSLYYASGGVAVRPPVSRSVSDDTVDIDYQALGGVTWRIDRHVAMFGEYRFTHRTIGISEVNESICIPLGACTVTERAETTLATHHFLVGLSFWF